MQHRSVSPSSGLTRQSRHSHLECPTRGNADTCPQEVVATPGTIGSSKTSRGFSGAERRCTGETRRLHAAVQLPVKSWPGVNGRPRAAHPETKTERGGRWSVPLSHSWASGEIGKRSRLQNGRASRASGFDPRLAYFCNLSRGASMRSPRLPLDVTRRRYV